MRRDAVAQAPQLVIVNYHCVTPHYEPSLYGKGCWSSTAQFVAELETLQRHFSILPLHDALAQLRAGTLTGRVAAITLDDGDISLQHHTAALLTRLGIPATFFINSDYLGKPEQDWVSLLRLAETGQLGRVDGALLERGRALRTTTDASFYRATVAELERHLLPLAAPRAPRYVDYPFLAELPELLHVGLHGGRHERYAMMPAAWQLEDLARNRARLSPLKNFRPLFAVPFGRPHDWNAATLAASSELGLTMLLADGGINYPQAGAPVSTIRRIPADSRAILEILDRQWQAASRPATGQG
jgi:peptidoglycan/xylan/chitin deacetylase (PgdA/CDA1 family)